MAKTQSLCLEEVIGYFDQLEDPRSTINRKHPLDSVVVMAMMAVLAGAGGPTAIARWAPCQAEFLSKVLKLPNGIPRKDVFRRVLALLKPDAFQTCFAAWLQSLRARAATRQPKRKACRRNQLFSKVLMLPRSRLFKSAKLPVHLVFRQLAEGPNRFADLVATRHEPDLMEQVRSYPRKCNRNRRRATATPGACGCAFAQ